MCSGVSKSSCGFSIVQKNFWNQYRWNQKRLNWKFWKKNISEENINERYYSQSLRIILLIVKWIKLKGYSFVENHVVSVKEKWLKTRSTYFCTLKQLIRPLIFFIILSLIFLGSALSKKCKSVLDCLIEIIEAKKTFQRKIPTTLAYDENVSCNLAHKSKRFLSQQKPIFESWFPKLFPIVEAFCRCKTILDFEVVLFTSFVRESSHFFRSYDTLIFRSFRQISGQLALTSLELFRKTNSKEVVKQKWNWN